MAQQLPSPLKSQLGLEPEQGLQNLPKIRETEVGPGVTGNIDTIKIMKKIARERSGDPLIRRLALNILEKYRVPSHFCVQECLAIGDYVKRKVRYVKDPDNIEYIQDPIDLVKQIQNGLAQGDCDDMSLLTATLLLSIGHQPFFRAVRYGKTMHFNHIYVVVYEKNPHQQRCRIALDCILKEKEIGSEISHLSGEEFEV